MTEQEILKQAWICSNMVDNSKATSVFTMGEREVLKFAHSIGREQQRIEELELEVTKRKAIEKELKENTNNDRA